MLRAHRIRRGGRHRHLLWYSRYAVPHALLVDIADTMDKYGRLKLIDDPVNGLVMVSNNLSVLEVPARSGLLGCSGSESMISRSLVHPSERGHPGQALLKVGWLTEDLAGYVDGEAHEIDLAEDGWTCATTNARRLRVSGTAVLVLWCCLAAPERLWWAPPQWRWQKRPLWILLPARSPQQQWRDELIWRTR